MIFLEGYILGLGMILFIGPVFFLLLSISLQLGTKAGILTAFGIIISDVICIYLCKFGVLSFIDESSSKFWIALSGGLILILLGCKYILKPTPSIKIQQEIQKLQYIACFTKGFLVNFVNPFVFFVWIGVITYLRQSKVTDSESSIYLLGSLTAILSTDLLKVLAARQIKSRLNPKALKYLFRISGVALICFGVRLLLLLI